MDMFYTLLAEYYSNIFIRRKLQGRNFFERHIETILLRWIWKLKVILELNLAIFCPEYMHYLHLPKLLYEYAVMLDNISQFIDVDIEKLNNYHNFYPVFIMKEPDGRTVNYIKYAVLVDNKTVVAIIVNTVDVGIYDLAITVKRENKEISFNYQEGTKDKFNRSMQKILSKTLRRIIFRNTKNVLFRTTNKL